MSDWKLPWEGGCRCGKTRIKITQPPMLSAVCHCYGCQTMTASAFSMSMGFPPDGLEVTEGKTVRGGLTTENEHNFCSECLTWMFTRPGSADFFVNVRASLLDDHSWYVPFAEFCTKEKLAWVTTPAEHSYPGIPPMEDFPELLKAYAEKGVRPR